MGRFLTFLNIIQNHLTAKLSIGVMSMIIIHAFFKIDTKHRKEFLEQAKKVAVLSQAEEGNISYFFYEDPENLGELVFLEKWKDQSVIQQHEETSHFKLFTDNLQKYLIEPLRIELFEAKEINK
jgi:quinol monooxygenase YgiN